MKSINALGISVLGSLMIMFMAFIFSLSLVSAWSSNTFTNGLANENITFGYNNYLPNIDSLSHYYTFENTINDSFGILNLSNGTVNYINNGLNGIGINNSKIYNNLTNDINLSQDLTICMWIKEYCSGGACSAKIFIGIDNQSDRNYLTNGAFVIGRFGGGAQWQFGTDNWNTWAGFTTATLNTWEFLCAMQNNTGVYLYQNATLVDETIWAGTRPSSGLARQIIIGGDASITNNFTGSLDELSIWNRSLSNSEINEIYNNSFNINMLRYLQVPQNTYLTNARMNLSALLNDSSISDYTKSSFNFSTATRSTLPSGITEHNGTNFYICDFNEDKVFRYSIDGTYSNLNFSLTPYDSSEKGISIYKDVLYFLGASSDKIYIMNLSGYNSGLNFSVATQDNNGEGIRVRNNTIYYVGYGTEKIYAYNLSGTYTGFNFSTSSQTTTPTGVEFVNDNFYVLSNTDKKIYQYNSSGSYTNINLDISKYGGLLSDILYYNNSFYIPDYDNDIILRIDNFVNNLNISINNIQLYNYQGSFTHLNNRTNNFYQAINNYLSTCSYVGGSCYVPIQFSSSTIGILQYSDLIFNNFGITENGQSFNSTTYETANENFMLNTSIDTNYYTSINGYLIYNGTSYLGSKSVSGNNIIFTKNLDIPLINSTQNRTFYWQINLNNGTTTEYYNSTIYNQTVSPIIFTPCNLTYTTKFINFTFKDEDTLSFINATIPLSTFNYYLGNGSVNKSLTYTNTTSNPSFIFCANPNRTFYVNPYMQYEFTDYPQRVYNPNIITLTNSTTNQILYLASSSNGLYVTFQVVNSADQVLSGIFVNVSRVISGETAIVGYGTTGSDGGVTFWLNPDFVHTACFSSSQYDTYCVTQAFTQSSYTINLASSIISDAHDYNKGITYSILPINYSLINNTDYTFSFTLDSSYWSLDSFGFNITNQNHQLLGSDSDLSSGGGTTSINLNTGTNETFYVTYYWIIDGSTSQFSKTYYIINFDNNIFSIKRLVDDFSSYVTLGFFGLTDFGVGLLCFLIILGITGLIKMKYSISDESVLIGVIFSLVALLDVGFNLIPNPLGAVTHFPTVAIGLIFLGFLFKEVYY